MLQPLSILLLSSRLFLSPQGVDVTTDKVSATVKSEAELLWQEYVRQRSLPDGSVQTVLHLISPPPVTLHSTI